MTEYLLTTENLHNLVRQLIAEATIYAPINTAGRKYLEIVSPNNIDRIDLDGFRTVDTFKTAVFKISEQVARYFGQEEAAPIKKQVFLGIRACDLEGLSIGDRVFLEGDITDPFYKRLRENLLLISADCNDCGPTCFCTVVKGNPYPTRFFDLNLSPVDEGFIVEAKSEPGRALVDKYREYFNSPSDYMTREKNNNRREIIKKIANVNAAFHLRLDLTQTHKANLENKIWKTLTKDCVECSACNFACPSCTCFLLLDGAAGPAANSRHKVWDACLKNGYSEVAGGAN